MESLTKVTKLLVIKLMVKKLLIFRIPGKRIAHKAKIANTILLKRRYSGKLMTNSWIIVTKKFG